MLKRCKKAVAADGVAAFFPRSPSLYPSTCKYKYIHYFNHMVLILDGNSDMTALDLIKCPKQIIKTAINSYACTYFWVTKKTIHNLGSVFHAACLYIYEYENNGYAPANEKKLIMVWRAAIFVL